MPTRPRTSSSPRPRSRGRIAPSGAGSAICGGRRRRCGIVRPAMPVVEGVMGSTLPARPAAGRTGAIAPAAAAAPATAPYDRTDEPEDDEQEEQPDEEPEEPEEGVPTQTPAVAVGRDDDWRHGCSSGGRSPHACS